MIEALGPKDVRPVANMEYVNAAIEYINRKLTIIEPDCQGVRYIDYYDVFRSLRKTEIDIVITAFADKGWEVCIIKDNDDRDCIIFKDAEVFKK